MWRTHKCGECYICDTFRESTVSVMPKETLPLLTEILFVCLYIYLAINFTGLRCEDLTEQLLLQTKVLKYCHRVSKLLL